MLLLVLGVLLWAGAHLFKRLAPGARAAMGDKGRGPIALALLASVILMILGYRMYDGTFYWGPAPALKGINNLLMLVSVYLFAAAGMKTRAARVLRHPQLTGFALWCVAHLLPNGDTPSFILWGGLLVWALLEMALINACARPGKERDHGNRRHRRRLRRDRGRPHHARLQPIRIRQ